MRRVLALSLAILLVILPLARADRNNPRDPDNVNEIISVVSSPQLAPGESGTFVVNFTNPYGCLTCAMQNIVLNASIYRYATIDETLPVDGNWGWAYPRFSGSANPREILLHTGIPSDRLGVNPTDRYIVERFTVQTSQDMPHGSVFAQSAYFVRFWLAFDFNNGTGPIPLVMASKGYFTDVQWAEARIDPANPPPGCNAYNATNRCLGGLNLTRLGVDGLLPDTAFGVKEPIPLWPFYALLVLTGFFLVLAFLYWVEENPGRYPRIERMWLTFKGRLRRIIRFPRAKKT